MHTTPRLFAASAFTHARSVGWDDTTLRVFRASMHDAPEVFFDSGRWRGSQRAVGSSGPTRCLGGSPTWRIKWEELSLAAALLLARSRA